MAAELAADLVVMITTLYGDQLRAARVCRAWSLALVDVPRLVYDSRVRVPTLDAARRYTWLGRTLDEVRAAAAVCRYDDRAVLRNLVRDAPWTHRCPREVRAPNAWELRGHVRPLARSQVTRMLREALGLGGRRPGRAPPPPSAALWPAARVPDYLHAKQRFMNRHSLH